MAKGAALGSLQQLVPAAQPALVHILDSARGAIDPPIRSEIFGLQRFIQHGRSLGLTHRAAPAGAGASTFFPRLNSNIRALRQAYQYIGEQASTGYDISPAAEWLLGNFHLIDAQLQEVHGGLPLRYFRALPVLLDEPLAGLPRVYSIAWAFVAHTDGAFDEELLVQFLCAYQETRDLNLGEVWALPNTLRVVLIENLRRLAERVAASKAARQVANLCSDVLPSFTVATLDRLLAMLDARGVGLTFLVQLAQRLQDQQGPADASIHAPYHQWVQYQWVARQLPTLSIIQTQQEADQAANNLSVSNAVTSLRAIGDADWPSIVARASALMRLMLSSPQFEAEHTATRDQTLHGIEKLARRTGRSENDVAQALIALLQTAADPHTGRVRGAQHWIAGAGHAELVSALGIASSGVSRWADRLRGQSRRLWLVYLGAVLMGTLLVVLLSVMTSATPASRGLARSLSQAFSGDFTGFTTDTGSMLLGLFAIGLMLVVTSEWVVAVINRLISESVPPQHLARLAFTDGIPPEHRVLVVIPALLTDPASIQALAHRLRLHFLANPEQNAQFALLTDWVDAHTEQATHDRSLLDCAIREVTALNALHPMPSGALTEVPRFIVLHRSRTFCDSEQRWIGWERKRGKLEQLIALLARQLVPGTAVDTARHRVFAELGALSRIATHTPYVVTLDSDTELPPGRLRELVGVAAHPHNQPQLDTAGRRVVHGYGILQPRVAVPLPTVHAALGGVNPRPTLFHALFAGQCGIDPYSAATSEVYQDLFDEGTFTGKGLLHVQAVHAVLGGRLPQNRVLSHDLLEGSMARCAAVSDITLVEDAPFHSDVAASRQHRWMRGDWQLLPFLLSSGRRKNGGAISVINRWKMFDNLRRSMVAPASLALLICALAGVTVSPAAAVALVLATYMAGPLMGAVAGFSPSRDDIAKRHFYRQAFMDLVRTILGALWHGAQLLHHARLALDAVVRALYRLYVSHRLLLQWTTAAAAQANASTALSTLVRQHRATSLLALLLLTALLVSRTPHPWLAGVLCGLWALSPVWTWWVSRSPPASESAQLTAAERTAFESIARDTWRFFERCVNEQTNALPPDNLQITPHETVANRTSPTNIGLYLLSAACARRFGWIDTLDLLSRLDATLATLDRLQRHRGHFLNWYDTSTCAPLMPMYVSTVDSGNLSGHLLAVAQACLELSAQEALHAERLIQMAARLEGVAWAAEFGFLYSRRRRLLHIGYRVAEQQMDSGFYDLLASESRLTSLLAIAKGDVPVRHWSALGRPFYAVGTQVGLRSWSGSMFEYLMPTLVLDEPQGSVLQQACRAALAEQMAFARAHNVPWGISESAYAGRDHTLAYQYAPQGVPRLALRRTPPSDLVVAPYATALAAQICPSLAATNFVALQALSARGAYGFIEALDYSPAQQTQPVVAGQASPFMPVDTFMAHHQGMTIVALANVLLGGVAQRWGMANAYLQAVAPLLHERAPREISVLHMLPAVATSQAVQQRAPGLLRDVLPGHTALQPTHLLSNGRYSVTLRANGAGYSRWGTSGTTVGITRSRDDALTDACGSFFYLRMLDATPRKSAGLYSLSHHPAPDPAAHYESTFHADRVCLSASWPLLRALTTTWVSPEDDIEFRRVELHNRSFEAMDLELISAFDITLADPRADEAHPAFSGMFVRAQWVAAHQALVFERKPRLATEGGMHAAHFLTDVHAQVAQVRIQTDRLLWLGRNRNASQAAGQLAQTPTPSAAPVDSASPDVAADLETGLDPVCVLAVRLRLAPGAKASLTFATAASNDRTTLRAVIDKYRQPSHVQRASLMSATLAGIRLRAMPMSAANFAAVQQLTSCLVQGMARLNTALWSVTPGSDMNHGVPSTSTRPSDLCDRRLLWRFGMSGERPLILVFASSQEALGLLRTLAQALRIWAWGGVGCDMVVVNLQATSYQDSLHRELVALRERHRVDAESQTDAANPTAMYVLRRNELSTDEMSTLQHLARARFSADGRPLHHHVEDLAEWHEYSLAQRQRVATSALVHRQGPGALSMAQPALPQNAVPRGRFAADGGEFSFDVDGQRPTRPWINVLANAGFGAQLSEVASGYTWARNSRLNQITAWSNDPVTDPPAELFLLQDCNTQQLWQLGNVTQHAAHPGTTHSQRVVHGQGYSVITHRAGDVQVTISWCVDSLTSVKHIAIDLMNLGSTAQRLRLIGVAQWLMGSRAADRFTTQTQHRRQRLTNRQQGEQQLSLLLCTQLEHTDGFGGGTAFWALATPPGEEDDFTCDRRECWDARGHWVVPDHFGRQTGVGLDPCAALATRLVLLPAGQSAQRVFLMGYAANPDAAGELAVREALIAPATRLAQVRQSWDALLGATQVKTPDPLFDALVNRWLLYQTVSCRLWAKAGFYQAGGATGFRDQLQDAMALAWAAPVMLREQIVLCASRQFAAGDVQHWWHAPGGAGVRTHFSDDLLWLAHALLHYLRATGDNSLLDEPVPFLEGSEIPEGAEDIYETPRISLEVASVYEHAARTLDHSLRVGIHGLPLMGTGDWNDGMNRVGHEGRGESVWLAWFSCKLVADFVPLARSRGDVARVARWEEAAVGWRAALDGPAWDGEWFKRAFFDDGQPLGSHANTECRIDLIAQAWSVLSGAASLERQRTALASMQTHLVDDEAGLIKLLDPPLAHAQPSAGYIQAYPPGVRENGGQYAHAGVWALMAQAQFQGKVATDDDSLPYRYFTYLSPAHRTAHPTRGAAYGLEPYVMAGDVYTQPPYVGRGGWSWYTGAAAWMHRAAVEALFGVCQTSHHISLTPCLPVQWSRAEITLIRGTRSLRFILVRGDEAGALEQAANDSAQTLRVGQAVTWQELDTSSCFVMVV